MQNCRELFEFLKYLLPPQGFGPDGQNQRRHPRGPRIREENFAEAEKISIFQEKGWQGIATIQEFIQWLRKGQKTGLVKLAYFQSSRGVKVAFG